MHERFCERIETALSSLGTARRARSRWIAASPSARSADCWARTRARPRAYAIHAQSPTHSPPVCGWMVDAGRMGRLGRRHSEGCYVLRTNVTDWTPEALWQTYIQLTEAEAAFRIHKSELRSGRSGISAQTASRRTSSCASSPMCCGRRSSSGKAAPAWATLHAPSFKNSPPSTAPTLFCRPQLRRHATCACAASFVPTRPSRTARPPRTTPAGTAPREPRLTPNVVPTLQPNRLKNLTRLYETAEVGLTPNTRPRAGSAIEFWPSSADGFWPTPGPSTYGRPSRSGGLAWTGEPKWICSSSFVGSMSLVSGR